MAVAAVVNSLVTLGATAVPTEVEISINGQVLDTVTGVSAGLSTTAIAAGSDTTTQIEDKVRDAVIAKAAELGFTLLAAGCFQPQLRRG